MPAPTSPGAQGATLSTRALNRATLARQLLLRRHDVSAADAIAHLVALQSQAPKAPYVGLWSRLAAFRPEELEHLMTTRRVVRLVSLRGTVHLTAAADALALRAWTQPVLDRAIGDRAFVRAMGGADTDEVAEAGRALLDARPMTAGEAGRLLADRFPGGDPRAYDRLLRVRLPLVQVPPRGLWTGSGQPVCTTAEAWLGGPAPDGPGPDDLVLRYLAAFGPASPRDAQVWSGLTRLGEVFERLRPRLRVFRGPDGRDLYDLPDAPRPDPGTPAPVRLVAEYDNLTLSHADRTRVVSDDARARMATPNGIIPGTVLVDGFVAGTWKIVRARRSAVLAVTPFAPLAAADRAEVEAEGARLLAFAAAGAVDHDVRVAAP
jgi:hypothetical protein